MPDTRKLIKSSWFTPVSIKQIEGTAPKIVVQNFVDQGLTPTAESNGVLASLQNYPLAYYDTPTANKQIFQKALWQGLYDNEDIQFRMKESKSFFGEPSHQDSLEVLLPQVSHRVTDFSFNEGSPLVLGSVDVLDTPMGNIIHSLMKSSWIGISSRGYGTLVDANDGENQIVSASDYLHVCWDFVGVPAVKEAMATISGYAKSHKLVEPIVHALLLASKRDAMWGDLARIVQSDNTHKTVVVEKKPVKSSKGWDWNTDRYGGLSITLDGKDVAYLQGDEANQLDDELEAAKTEEDVQRILDEYGVLLESKADSTKKTVVVKKIRSALESPRWDAKEDRYGGIAITYGGKDVAYLQGDEAAELSGQLEKAQTEEDVQRILDEYGVLLESKAVLSADSTQNGKATVSQNDQDHKFYFTIGGHSYGPFDTAGLAENEMTKVEASGLFSTPEFKADWKPENGPGKEAGHTTKATSSKSTREVTMPISKKPIQSGKILDFLKDTFAGISITPADEGLSVVDFSAGGESQFFVLRGDEKLLHLEGSVADAAMAEYDKTRDVKALLAKHARREQDSMWESLKLLSTKRSIKSEEASPTLELPAASGATLEGETEEKAQFSPEEEADRKEFDKMVLLELAETLADTGDADVSDEEAGFDFGEDDLNYPPVQESKRPIKSESDPDVASPESSDKGDEDLGGDEDTFFPDEDLGAVTVDEASSTITVETTSPDGDSVTVDLKLEDGFLTQEGGTLVDLDNDQEAGEDNEILPEGSVDLFEECNGDVSAAVDYILDLPNGTDDLSNIIDLTEDEGSSDGELGTPATEDVTASKKTGIERTETKDAIPKGGTIKQPISKKPGSPKPIAQAEGSLPFPKAKETK